MFVLLTLAALPLAIAPVVSVVGSWPPLIRAVMLFNPWILTAGVSHLDILRMEWVYALSPLGRVEAPYAGLGLGVAVFGGVGIAFMLLAVRALHVRDRWQ